VQAPCSPLPPRAGVGGVDPSGPLLGRRAVLTEIYLCDVCSCQEMLRRNGPAAGQASLCRLINYAARLNGVGARIELHRNAVLDRPLMVDMQLGEVLEPCVSIVYAVHFD
jgi:hypothetical protein